MPLKRLLQFTTHYLLLTTSLSAAPNFIPPSNLKCVAALGNTDHLAPALRTLLLDTADYAPIPEPGPLDWLSSHEEPGQTFPQFYASNFNTPTEDYPNLYLQPIGPSNLSPADTELLSTYCTAFFNTPVKTLPTLLVDPNQVRSRVNQYTAKPQLHAADILEVLKQNRPDDAYAVIAYTLTDLYPHETWNFVFGLANLRQSVGVFSFARYGDPQTDPVLFRQRALKVMSHEIGHMYGLQHCIYYHCLMNGSNTLDETDKAPMHLCPVCLRKLHSATQFDPLTRYAQLNKFYQTQSLPQAATFTQKRLTLLLNSTLEP
ncbi:conserved hypothetical protein [Verrucomicrobiia bacterium DG1235]|nr:conserved hypothetical protein [Verrucomicrobiae bacterium DG1235]